MGCSVCMSAMTMCPFGMAPSTLMVLPANMVMGMGMPIANLLDSKPFMNIMPFGMCITLSNPMVAAATAAALGVLTPMPCIPAVTAPWTPAGPKPIIKGMPVVDQNSKAMCMWGGVINVTFPGQVKIMES